MMRVQWLAVLLAMVAATRPGIVLAQAVDSADDERVRQASAAPQPDKTVRDPEFGVAARHLGLQRRVEMYQWQAVGQGYVRTWSEQPLDSSGFSPGHDNPPFPLQGKRWRVDSVSVDGRPLDATVLDTLGRWRDFRPSFNALPGNLAATFQPQGDGLGSAENPLDPQIGDLRISWRDLVLPPLQDRIVLRAGRWQLAPIAVANADAADGDDAPLITRQHDLWLFGARWWWLVGAVVIVFFALFAARRRKRKH